MAVSASKRILVVLLAALLLCGVSPAVSASTGGIAAGLSGDGIALGCSTAEELHRRLSADEGGVIDLTGNIQWDRYAGEIEVRNPVLVRMGGYGIQITEDARLALSGPVRFEGAGSPSPLIRVEGSIRLGPGVAVAAEGECAVAVAIIGSWDADFVFASISAQGNRATAVLHQGFECNLAYSRVEARGQSATGIRACGDVYLTGCEVLADSQAVVSGTGRITLDTTRALPAPPGAKTITRRAVPGNRIQQNGISVPVGTSRAAFLDNAASAHFELVDTNGTDNVYGNLYGDANWDNLPEDWSRAGATMATCIPSGIPDWLPVEGIAPFAVPIHLVAEHQLHIDKAFRFASTAVGMRFYHPIEGAEDILLWVSSDAGITWWSCRELRGSNVDEYGAAIAELPPNRDYQFRAQVVGGPMEGYSNILCFPYYDTDPDRQGGGDDDYGDRDDQGEQPPAPIDPPTTLPTDPAPEPAGPDGTVPRPERGGGSDTADRAPAGGKPSKAVAAPLHADRAVRPLPPPAADAVTLTGEQAADQLIANPRHLTITQSGMKVVIPAAALRSIGWTDEQSFTAVLDMPDAATFSVRFWVGETELTDFGEDAFAVHVPHAEPQPGSDVLCQKNGETFASAGYENGRLEFHLRTTGEYTIFSPDAPEPVRVASPAPPAPDVPAAAEAPAAQTPPSSSLTWALPAALPLAGGAVCLGIRRQKGAKR